MLLRARRNLQDGGLEDMTDLIFKLRTDDKGQDVAEYAVMLVVALAIWGVLRAPCSGGIPLFLVSVDFQS
jgi:hypothetical protein